MNGKLHVCFWWNLDCESSGVLTGNGRTKTAERVMSVRLLKLGNRARATHQTRLSWCSGIPDFGPITVSVIRATTIWESMIKLLLVNSTRVEFTCHYYYYYYYYYYLIPGIYNPDGVENIEYKIAYNCRAEGQHWSAAPESKSFGTGSWSLEPRFWSFQRSFQEYGGGGELMR